MRGVFEYNKKEYDKAQRDFQTAIDLGSRTAVIYIARGMIFLNKHDTKNAYCGIQSRPTSSTRGIQTRTPRSRRCF